MSIENVITNHNKVDSALATLRANRRYRKDKRTHGINRVDLYVADVDGDWLENWEDSEHASEPDH